MGKYNNLPLKLWSQLPSNARFLVSDELQTGPAKDSNVTKEQVETGVRGGIIVPLHLVCGDEVTPLIVGVAKVTFRMPFALTLTAVRASATEAPTGSLLTVDINQNGSSILSTKLTIDDGEKTSVTAAAPAVISTANLADDAEISVDIDSVGSTLAGKGLKLWLLGVRT